MANGDWISLNKDWAQVKLLDATASAADDGVWIDCQRYTDALLEFVFSANATVEVRVSNAAAKPANNTHGTLFIAAITQATSPLVLTISVLPRWLKARTTANTGTITVIAAMRTAGG